uniref:Nonstructural protein NS38 n=1 Tax=Grass carp hemorrhagic virus TaxID=128986 RepID=Q9IF02_GCRV|nr:nonstructural protein NS38 [Grass carp hemorrhagic virus]
MAHTGTATLINAERTDRTLRLLETFPSLTITIRQDTSGRDLVSSVYSATGMSAAARNLNPIANVKNMRQPGYVKPAHTATNTVPLRVATSTGLELPTAHLAQMPVDQALRDAVAAAVPAHAARVLPPNVDRVTPLTLASRVAMVCAGLDCDDIHEIAPAPTAMALAFTTKVLLIHVVVDGTGASIAVNPGAARDLLKADQLGNVITNYGYDVRGTVRRYTAAALAPSELPDTYPIEWLGLICGLIATQIELDLDMLAMNQTEQKLIAPHVQAVDPFINRLQSYATLSSRLMHLCVTHAQRPFRDFPELLRHWQKPELTPAIPVNIALKGAALEVSGNGAELFRVRALPIGGM